MTRGDHSRDDAIAALRAAQADYASERAATAESLERAQLKREGAMRLVAALGISHRKIGELTGLSHTRVNQILGVGRRAVPEAHLPPDFGAGPSDVRSAVVRLLASEARRSWTREEIRCSFASRGWPTDGLDEAITALAAEGSILSADHGQFTIQAVPTS